MGTTERSFSLTSTVWDGTAPPGGDVRQLLSTGTLPAAQSGGSVDLGTSGTKEITVDPFTAGRTTTGAAPEFGWAINISGSDGMDSAADAKRFIPAGEWTFQGTLAASPATAASGVEVDVGVYRVAAAPSTTRTLLFTVTAPAVLPTTAGVSWFVQSTQPQYVLEAGETLQAMYVITGTGQVGGLTIDFRIGDHAVTNDAQLDLPQPGVRTQYQETISTTCVGVATVLDGTKTVTGVARDSTGTPVTGATLKLFNQDTDVKVGGDFTTGADGVYTFTRADNDTTTYWVVGFSDATHHGTSDRGLTAT